MLKNRLSSLEKSLTAAQDKQKANQKKSEALDKEIETLEKQLKDAKKAEQISENAYIVAYNATKTAKTNVENAEKAYKVSEKTWNDHIKSCYDCQSMVNCRTENRLYNQKNRDWKLWDIAERRLDIAEANEKKKRDDWKPKWETVKKHRKKLGKLESDRTKLISEHAALLTKIQGLTKKIGEKQRELLDAELDLVLVENAKTVAPDYVKKFNAARDADKDMKQWVEDNPPPEALEKFVKVYFELLNKYIYTN